MLKIKLSGDQRLSPGNFRRQASSGDSEKALMILLSNDDKSVPEIGRILKRHQHTVRDWLKRYKSRGIKGLKRKFSPGRPATLRKKIKQHIQKIIDDSPIMHGYRDGTWSVFLITSGVNKNPDTNAGSETVRRALKDMGYVYKRPSGTVSGHAPSRKDKQKALKKMVRDISQITDQQKSVVYTLDESHFPTEPCPVQGWFKKR